MTAHASASDDIVVVQNAEMNLSYFKIDSEGTVRVGEGLQEKPILINANGTSSMDAARIKPGASLLTVIASTTTQGFFFPQLWKACR